MLLKIWADTSWGAASAGSRAEERSLLGCVTLTTTQHTARAANRPDLLAREPSSAKAGHERQSSALFRRRRMGFKSFDVMGMSPSTVKW